jgi:tRNA (cytidine/uridine-2'-O-)-methyltransferase
LSTHATQSLQQARFAPGDWLVFGAETKGLSTELKNSLGSDHLLRLPMLPGQRSLNLSNAVAVVVYEAWRQQGYAIPASPAPQA